MIYEFISTNKCNRNCRFCWVEKGSYLASKIDALKFIQEVQNFEDNQNRRFKISLFGGEPLLNIDVLEMIINAFKDDKRCQINIATNGDLIFQNLARIQRFSNVKWHITAYDFKNQPKKYLDMIGAISSPIFSFTFTDLDIDDVDAFKEFARDVVHSQYKIAFSHSPSSWKSTDVQTIHSKVMRIMTKELEDIITDGLDIPIQSILADHYLSLVIGAVARMKCKLPLIKTNCLSGFQKISFFNGHFCGRCMRLPESKQKQLADLDIVGCHDCDYDLICTKSCIAEVDANGNVDEKLCAIEKSCFDAIASFAEKHQCNDVWRDKVLKYYLNETINGND